MIFAIIVSAVFVLMFLSDLSGQPSSNRVESNSDRPYDASTRQQQASRSSQYQDPYYSHGPVFSPGKRYIWDGRRWVRVENNFSTGLIIGIILAIIAIAVF